MKWLVVLAASLLLMKAATAQEDPESGLKLAIKWCSKCHVIGKYNHPYGGINSTPSFFIMAERPEVYMQKVLTVLDRRPHASLDFDLKPRDLQDIKAYVAGVKREP